MEALNTSIDIKEEPLPEPENQSSDEDGRSTNMDNINVEDLPEDYFADLIGLNVVDEWAAADDLGEKRPGNEKTAATANKTQQSSAPVANQQKSTAPSSTGFNNSAKPAQIPVTGAKTTTPATALTTPASDSQINNVPKIKAEPKSPVNPDDDEDTIPFDPTQATNENFMPTVPTNDSSNLNMSLRLRQEMAKPTATTKSSSETGAKSSSELPKSNKQTQSPSKLTGSTLEERRSSADQKSSGKHREEKKFRSEKHGSHESKEKKKKSPSRKRRSSKSPDRRSRDHFSMSPEVPKPKTERLKVGKKHPAASGNPHSAPGIVPLMDVNAFVPPILAKGVLENSSEAPPGSYRERSSRYSPRRRSRSPRRYSPGRRYRRSRSPGSRRSRSPLSRRSRSPIPRRSRSPIPRRSRTPLRRRSRSPIPRRSRSPALRRTRSRSPSRRSRSPRKRRSYSRSPRRRSISRSPSRRSNRSPTRRRSSSEERYIARLNSRRRRQKDGSPDSPLSMSISPSPPRRKSPLRKIPGSRSKSPTRPRSPWKQPEWTKDVPTPAAPLTVPAYPYAGYTDPNVVAAPPPQIPTLMPSTQQPAAPYYNMPTQPPPPGTVSFQTPYYNAGGLNYGTTNFQQPPPVAPLAVPPPQQQPKPVPLPPVVYPNLVPRPVPAPSVQPLANKPSMMYKPPQSSTINIQPPANAPVPGRPGLRVVNMATITDQKLPIAKPPPPQESSSDDDDEEYEVSGIPTDMPLSSFLEASLDVGKRAPIKSYIVDTVETSIEKLEMDKSLMIAPPFIVNPDRSYESVRKLTISTSKNHPSIFLKGTSKDMEVNVAISSLNIRAVHLPRKPKFLPQQRMLAKALLKKVAVPTADACTMTDPMPEPEPAECMECFIRNEKDFMNRWTQTLPPVRHSIYVQVGTGLENIHNPVTFRNNNPNRFENRLGPQREVVLVENETIAFGYAPRSTLPKPPQPPSPPRYPLEPRYKPRSPDRRSPPDTLIRHGFIDHDRPEFDPMSPPGPSNPPPSRGDIRSRLAPPDDRYFQYGGPYGGNRH